MQDRERDRGPAAEPQTGITPPIPPPPRPSPSASEALAFYAAAFETLPFPATLIDIRGTILDINQAMIDFALNFGRRIRKQDRLGYPVHQFADSPENQQRLRDFVTALFSREQDDQLDWATEKTDKGVIAVIIHGRLLRAADGRPIGALLVRENATAQEQQTRRKQIIHRVREQVWAMRSSADIAQLLRTVRLSLRELGLRFSDCAVNMVDTRSGKTLAWFNNMAEDGQWFLTEADDRGAENLISIWKSRKVAYRRDLAATDEWGENPYIHLKLGHQVRSVVDIPFSHGTLAVNSEFPEAFSATDIEALQEIAQVLEEGFSRLDDFHALDERNRKLELEIEARKNAEQLLRQSHQALERQVDERTADLRTINEKLQEEIAVRLQVEEQLKRSLQEKEMLLQEIHHRVKNNLQIVYSLLDLQSRDIADPQFQHLFQDSRDRIRSIAMIHEKLYQSSNLTHLDLAAYIDTLTRELCRSYGFSPDQVQLDLQVESIGLKVDQAIAVGLIITELVSNALKYAFPEGRRGRLNLALCRLDEGKAQLAVTDDGIGLPADLDLRQSRSLGLKLVNSLTNQLRGRMETAGPPGARFRIVFPFKEPEAS